MKNVLPWQRVPSISFISPAPGPWKSCGPPQNSHKQTLKTQSPPTVADFIGSLIPSKQLQTMIVIACWISCSPDSIAVDLPPEFLTVGQSCRMLDSRSSSPTMMSASWRSFFHRHGHGSERISGEFAVPGLGSNIENPGFFASEKKHQITGPIETKTVQKTFSIVPCPLIIIIGSRWSLHPHTFWFTHFSIRLGLDSSDWMVVPLVNRTGPSPQHKHSCGMLWNDHVHQN